MAEKVTVQLVDDIDGTQAESTVEFALDGVSYAIDLSEANATRLRDSLASYVTNATRTGGRKRPGGKQKTATPAPSTADRERNQAIRDWAKQQGLAVSDRGRIPASIIAQYDNR